MAILIRWLNIDKVANKVAVAQDLASARGAFYLA